MMYRKPSSSLWSSYTLDMRAAGGEEGRGSWKAAQHRCQAKYLTAAGYGGWGQVCQQQGHAGGWGEECGGCTGVGQEQGGQGT